MDKQLVINVLSPYQHKAVQIPKGWDFKVDGSPLIPASGVTMRLIRDGENIEVAFRLGVSSLIASLAGLKTTEFIVQYIHNKRVICTLGCKKVRDHVESKPVHQKVIF
jgi:hypothetical protein